MSTTSELRDDEHNVLLILRTNAKMKPEEIATHCGFSKQKVARIIAKLEKDKTIWGYSAVIDDERSSLSHFYMLLRRGDRPYDDTCKKAVLKTRLEDLVPGSSIMIENISLVNGQFDVVFSFWAKDLVEAKKFSEHYLKKFKPWTKDVTILEDILAIRRDGQRNPKIEEKIATLDFL